MSLLPIKTPVQLINSVYTTFSMYIVNYVVIVKQKIQGAYYT